MTAKGVQAAIREGGDGQSLADLLTPEEEQEELFAELDAGEEQMRQGAARVWNGRGRKPGSRNVTTKAIINYINSRYRNPLVRLAEIVSMTPEEVQAHFGVGPAKASDIHLKACAELNPYMASKQPMAVTVDVGEGFTPVTFVFGGGDQAEPDIRGGAAGDPAELPRYGEYKENQRVIDVDATEVAHNEGRTHE